MGTGTTFWLRKSQYPSHCVQFDRAPWLVPVVPMTGEMLPDDGDRLGWFLATLKISQQMCIC